MQDSCSHKPFITDDLYGPAVYPEYRHTGIAHRLIEAFVIAAKMQARSIYPSPARKRL